LFIHVAKRTAIRIKRQDYDVNKFRKLLAGCVFALAFLVRSRKCRLNPQSEAAQVAPSATYSGIQVLAELPWA
jgi:hypothetical protein